MKLLLDLHFKGNNNYNVDINILYARYSEKDDDWHSRKHIHPFTELFYCIKGVGEFVAEDKKFIMEEDDALIVNSDINHTELPIKDQDFGYIVIGIEGISVQDEQVVSKEDSSDDSYSDYIESYVLKASMKEKREELREIIAKVVDEMDNQNQYFEQISRTYIELFVLIILRSLKNRLTINSSKQENRKLEFIKEYLDVHYSRDINLDQLSNMIYINKYYLIHEYKKQYKMTPIEYLQEKRIEVAKDLLTNADYSMLEIAHQIGFNSQSYFNQVFKKKTSLTPIQYRNKYRKE